MSIWKLLTAVAIFTTPGLGLLPQGEPTQPSDCRSINFTYPIAGPCKYDMIKGPSVGEAFLFRQVNSESWALNTNQSFTPLERVAEGGSFDPVKAVASLPKPASVTSNLVLGYPSEKCESVDEIACLWVKVAYTLYNVTSSVANCDRRGEPEAFTVPFPNINNTGGNFYCQRGQENCPRNRDGVTDFDGCWVRWLDE